MVPFSLYNVATFTVSLAVICSSLSPLANIANRKTNFHSDTEHFTEEYVDENGVIHGQYGYRTPDGCQYIVRYQSGTKRYQVVGTTRLGCSQSKTLRPPTTRRTTRRTTTTTTPRTTTTTTPRTTTTTTTTTKPTTTTTKRTTRKTTTTPKPTTTTTSTTRRRVIGSAKQLYKTVFPPADMGRPHVLSPDDPDPIYSFGYGGPGHGHVQAGLPGGTKKGEYFFDSPDGYRRFVYYEATENGFFPRTRQERIPDWENSPLNPKNQFRDLDKRGKSQDEVTTPRTTTTTTMTTTTTQPETFPPPIYDIYPDYPEFVEPPRGPEYYDYSYDPNFPNYGGPHPGSRRPFPRNKTEERAKQLEEPVPFKPISRSNGCPYYFFTNTLINYHWERCIENGTRVGEYGRLADDGYSHKVSYYADERGFNPRVTKTPLTSEQENVLADFVSGAFIIPKIDEERADTERRINEWIEANREQIQDPLKYKNI